ncbi:hypothetical protein J6590_096337, partial [Homalodisca vitripennis]
TCAAERWFLTLKRATGRSPPCLPPHSRVSTRSGQSETIKEQVFSNSSSLSHNLQSRSSRKMLTLFTPLLLQNNQRTGVQQFLQSVTQSTEQILPENADSVYSLALAEQSKNRCLAVPPVRHIIYRADPPGKC